MLRRLLQATVKEYQSDYAKYFAVAMVYYALVSLVPLLLLLLAIVGWLLRVSPIAAAIEERMLVAVDTSFGSELRVTVEGLLQQLQEQSLLATVVSVGGLVLTVSILIRHLRMGFRAIWRYTPPWLSGSLFTGAWTAFREKVVAFAIVLSGALVLLAVIATLTALHGMSDFIDRTFAWFFGLPGSLAIVFVVFALLFKLLPPVNVQFRHIWLPSALCTLAWVVGVEVLVLYGAFFGSNVSAYGAIGGLLVAMLFMSTVSQVLFFGAELSKVMARDGDSPSHLIGPTANC